MPPQKRRRSASSTAPSKVTRKKASVTQSKDSNVVSSSSQPTNYWLIKAEPESRIEKGKDVKFSIDDLKDMPNSTSCWDGVRNYEARNIMRDQMKLGDLLLYYHSNCKVPGIVGIAKVVKEGYPDCKARNIMRDQMKLGDLLLYYHSNCKVPGIVGIAKVVKEDTAWDPTHPYYDPSSKKEAPRWFMVDVCFVSKFPHPISLRSLKDSQYPQLKHLFLLKRPRLSVQPVSSDDHT
ncbi:MAG: PUA-like domain-containing protein [Piptocephalis tieghemiana]|nr:MAG: PUA-like domain-containing protein [Piptocephalis tieghemiana]